MNLSRSWKTTLTGVIITFTGFVVFSPAIFGGDETVLYQICKYVTLGGFASFGILAKDYDK